MVNAGLILSASQISTYRDECKRKWGFKSIAKVATEQHASAALGTEVDDTQLQPYLKDGRPFDYSRPSQSGYIAASALAYLPEPQTLGLRVQKHFVIPSPTQGSGLSYQGYVDLWLPKGGIPGIEDGIYPVVCDFKTTGNLKWQKSAKTLETDVQAQLYATWAMYETGARTVDLVWIYMQTKGSKKAKRTHLRVMGQHVAEQFRLIDSTGLEMQAARQDIESQGTDLEALILKTLPANADACSGYGGCPFQGKCNLSPSVFVDAATAQAIQEMETIDMSTTAELLAALKAKRGAGINPPEKDIPVVVATLSTPPTQTLQPAIDADADVGQIAADRGVAAVEAPKRRGPGRPRSAPKDPLGADVLMYQPEPVPAEAHAADDAADTVARCLAAADNERAAASLQTLSCGKLTVSIANGNGNVVIEAMIREGERYTDTLTRLGVTL